MLQFDDTDRPLIRMTTTGPADRSNDTVAFITRIETMLAAGERFVLVLGEGMGDMLGGGRWRQVLPWALRRRRQLKRACAAVAVTATEATLPRVERSSRGLAWLLPAPLSIFSEVGMAEQWVTSRLASGRGQPVQVRHERWQPALASFRVLGPERQP